MLGDVPPSIPVAAPAAEAGPPAAPVTTTYRPAGPLDLRLTLSVLRRGRGDPALWWGDSGSVWRAARTSAGPVTLHLRPGRDGIAAWAWGPGAEHAVEQLPDLLGARDDPSRFDPRGNLVLHAAHRSLPGLRVPRTGDVVEALVAAVLEQRVQTIDAHAAWRWLLLRHGEPAPGPAPAGMRVPPDAHRWRRVPVWDWRLAGVDDQRTSTILRAMAVAARLQQGAGLPVAEAGRRLLTVRGIGPWTVGEVARRALGDTDAVSVGDLHLPRLVGQHLAGHRVDDAEMLAVLDQWRPHRQRVVRLLELTSGMSGSSEARHHPRPPRAVRPRPA